MIDEQSELIEDEVDDATASSSEEEQEEVESQADDEGQQPSEESEEEQMDDEVIITIGDEKPPEREDGTPLVRKLRNLHREAQKKNRELEAKLREFAEPKVQTLRKKPTLEDHEYDSDAYVGDIEKWVEEKKNIDIETSKRKQQEEEDNKEYNSKIENYNKSKANLKVKDYEDAEEFIRGIFTETQQGMLIDAADNPELVVYALYKNPAKAQELAGTRRFARFSSLIGKLEMKLKVSKRPAPPAPDKPLTGGRGKIGGGVNATLEKLRAEAMVTRDMTKLVQYRKKLKQKR